MEVGLFSFSRKLLLTHIVLITLYVETNHCNETKNFIFIFADICQDIKF